jgi:predicted TIM-barrel fold metal-dependent hydrolase
MTPYKIINVHTHLRKTDNVDARIKFWRKCGCEKVCIHVTGRTSEDVRHNNTTILPYLKKHSDILLGFALPELGWKPGMSEDIDKFKENGFYGLKFIAPSYDYDDERYFPLYERAAALNMPVLFHTGTLAELGSEQFWKISFEKMRASKIYQIARYFPQLRILVAHLGNPEFNIGLDLLQTYENVWADISGDSGSRRQRTKMLKLFSVDNGFDITNPEENLALQYFKKICFATDNPDPPVWIENSQEIMAKLEIPESIQEDFWWKNAERWLDIKL